MDVGCLVDWFFWLVMGGGTANGSAERSEHQQTNNPSFNSTKTIHNERNEQSHSLSGNSIHLLIEWSGEWFVSGVEGRGALAGRQRPFPQ